jgi:hypothetical protein
MRTKKKYIRWNQKRVKEGKAYAVTLVVTRMITSPCERLTSDSRKKMDDYVRIVECTGIYRYNRTITKKHHEEASRRSITKKHNEEA